MNIVDYDEKRKEVTITGCVNCPFCHYHERKSHYRPFCSLNEAIIIEDLNKPYTVIDYFPFDCPLRDTNFKITRIFE